MGNETYVDLEILARMDDEYLIRVSKNDLNTLVVTNEDRTIRHWDGKQPVVLEPYGNAVRTREDSNSTNNLTNLPNVDVDELLMWLMGEE